MPTSTTCEPSRLAARSPSGSGLNSKLWPSRAGPEPLGPGGAEVPGASTESPATNTAPSFMGTGPARMIPVAFWSMPWYSSAQ